MAVGARRRRRRPLVVLAVLATLVVLGLNAAISARSKEPSRRLEELAYLDRVRPIVQRSNEQAADLADVRATAATLGRAGIGRRLDRLSREALSVQVTVQRIEPPARLESAHALLEATLVIRAKAAKTVSSGLVAALGTEAPEPAVRTLVEAGEELNASDRTYEIYVTTLPKVDQAAKLPKSVWSEDPGIWSEPETAAFVASLRSAATLAPVHDVSVVVVTTDPAPVGTEGGAAVLPPLKSLHVDIVVANIGNESERRVTVMAIIAAPDGTIDTAREFVDLTPGQRQTIGLGLRPPKNASSLTVKIGPVDGENSLIDNEKIIPLLMR